MRQLSHISDLSIMFNFQTQAIESSHALAHAIRIARSGITGSVLVNLSGRGDKDLDFVAEHYGYGPDFLEKRGVKSGR